jgi:hypothetical protein
MAIHKAISLLNNSAFGMSVLKNKFGSFWTRTADGSIPTPPERWSDRQFSGGPRTAFSSDGTAFSSDGTAAAFDAEPFQADSTGAALRRHKPGAGGRNGPVGGPYTIGDRRMGGLRA